VIEVAGQIRRMKYRETMCGACPEHPVSKFANRDLDGLQGVPNMFTWSATRTSAAWGESERLSAMKTDTGCGGQKFSIFLVGGRYVVPARRHDMFFPCPR
jgi:hypothetical protein